MKDGQFEKLVDDAIAIVEANCADARARSDSIGILSYLRDFRTVRIDLGRGVGKTKYVRDHAERDDVIIVPTIGLRDHGYRDFRQAPCAARVFPVIDLDRARGLHPKRIFIDEGRMVDEALRKQPGFGDMGYLYHLFGRSTDQMFIIFA